MHHGGLAVACGAALASWVAGACTLTTSLDGLEGPAAIDGSDPDASPDVRAGDSGSDAPGVPPSLLSFTLIDATKVSHVGVAIAGFDPILEGAMIDRAVAGSSLSFRINTPTPTVGSLTISLNGGAENQNALPYSACGDSSDVWVPCPLRVGANSISATVYSLPDGAGTAGPRGTLQFIVK